MEVKTVRVTKEQYELLQEARKALEMRGRETLPSIATKCPRCGKDMEMLGIEFKYYYCPKCNYKAYDMRMSAAGSFALGAIAGLGAAALLYMLLKKEE
ncbi:MAG: hypothetical protein QME47_07680 [Candidatus Thermoplasmatota archaeon]|nr:hypothetical protein [Candidatus Thermoplasmatota archaeon]